MPLVDGPAPPDRPDHALQPEPRAFQVAHHCKDERGPLPEDSARNDNHRVLRFLSKVTINPARTSGTADEIGTLEGGKLADIVLWPIHSFGAKPALVVKGGLIGWAQMGDPNASLPTPQPVYFRLAFGAMGSALADTCVTFMSDAAISADVPEPRRPAGRGRCSTEQAAGMDAVFADD